MIRTRQDRNRTGKIANSAVRQNPPVAKLWTHLSQSLKSGLPWARMAAVSILSHSFPMRWYALSIIRRGHGSILVIRSLAWPPPFARSRPADDSEGSGESITAFCAACSGRHPVAICPLLGRAKDRRWRSRSSSSCRLAMVSRFNRLRSGPPFPRTSGKGHGFARSTEGDSFVFIFPYFHKTSFPLSDFNPVSPHDGVLKRPGPVVTSRRQGCRRSQWGSKVHC